jgi:hypothetical protein
MAIGQHGVSGDLVAGLIDARETPASDRFDEELAAGVERGEITPDAARRLKLWQRAAVSELADHIRAVLPAARDEATRRVKEREDAAEAAAVVAEPAIPAHPDAPAPVKPHDTPEPASDTTPPAPSSLETRPPRQLVADLVVTRTPAHHDHS